ncbi:ADP-ribosylation factor [Armadillidium nasatum]|uniref:small monomeric GTPase n=1 Tax=Armadillidium nasatum TaxID=96803 RepID=A0A5N5SXS3_9CRUS|nr:ADP-ribosylation factor [Armadillidium nasatum]
MEESLNKTDAEKTLINKTDMEETLNKKDEEETLNKTDTNCRILMVGLDKAGKTTILYYLKNGEIPTTIPTLGYNDEIISYKNRNFNVFDIGGLESIRALWKHYIFDKNFKALIYVIDCSEPSRLEEAKTELYKLLENDEAHSWPILVYANKQDLPEAVSPDAITEYFDLMSLGSRPWHVQPTCAINLTGVEEGFDWLASNINEKNIKMGWVLSKTDDLKKSNSHRTLLMGMNAESVYYKNLPLNLLDLSGREKVRPLWTCYYYSAKGIIYVVDSNDSSRLEEAKDELHSLLRFVELQNCPVLVYANKQDFPEAVSPDGVSDALDMMSLGSRPCHVQGSCAVEGIGVFEGLDWLVSNI